jgi:hypothetical protein
LKNLGEMSEPELRKTLSRTPSQEIRRRIEALLATPGLIRSPEILRGMWAIQVLERIGSVEAKQILEALAIGESAARMTQEAKGTLKRLASVPKQALK